jgi:hypothetical protein
MFSSGRKYLILFYFLKISLLENIVGFPLLDSVLLEKAKLDFYNNVYAASFLLTNPFFFSSSLFDCRLNFVF